MPIDPAILTLSATLADAAAHSAAEAAAGSRVPTMDGFALAHYLFTGAMLFALGMIGFVTRRNLIVMFLCTEMMFQGVVVTFAAFAKFHMNVTGQTFVVFVLTIAACEAALALGLVVLLFRKRRTLDAMAWSQLKG